MRDSSLSGTQGNSTWTSLFTADQKGKSTDVSTGESFPSGYSPANSNYYADPSQQYSAPYSKKSVKGASSANPYLPYQVPKPSNTTTFAELKHQLDKGTAEVVRLTGLLLTKETGAGQTLKAEHTAELRTLKESVHRLSGQLTEERDAMRVLRTELKTEKDAVQRLSGLLSEERDTMRVLRTELKTEKDVVQRLKTDLALEQRRAPAALQKKDEELASVRKQLREVESNLKSSAESRKELERSYDQLNRKNQELLLKRETGAGQTLKAEHTAELRTMKEAVHRLSGQLTEERDTMRVLRTELKTEKDIVQRLKTDLALEQRRAPVALQKKDEELASVRKQLREAESNLKSSAEVTNITKTLKAEHTAELRTQKEAVRRLSGMLTEERDAVRVLRAELKTEKDAVHWLQTDIALEQRRAPVALQKKDEELASVRKQLREAESNLKSSAESRKELQRSYDQLNRNSQGLDRSKTMVEIYENYRRWSEDQSCSSLGMKKYDSWQLEMAVNRANKESTGTTRYGAVYKSTLDQKDVVIEILNNKSHQKQQDFNQKVDILTRIRHPNLVSYIEGYEKKYALICENLPNGTLQDRLVNKRHTASFSWEERVQVSASICSTLLFLHNTKPSPIIHGDLEAQNISFDANNVCRLSVFGMSRSTQHTTTNNDNTVPSVQSDIRNFGIVLLQIVTGQGEKDLVRKKVLEMGDVNQFQEKDIGRQREVLTNKKIVDGRLGNWPTEDAVKMLLLGLRCSHPEENQRPCLATEVWTQIQSMS